MNSGHITRHLRARVAVPIVLVIFLVVIVTSAISLRGPVKLHGLSTTSITQVQFPSKNLPPSRDNDAGRARALDSTPDNDTDAWQRG